MFQGSKKSKMTLFFSKNVSIATKNSVKDFLGVPEIKEHEKYLGLLVVVGKNKRASLNFVKKEFGVKFRVEGEIALTSR